MRNVLSQDTLYRGTSAGDGPMTFVPPVVLRVEGLIKIYGKRRVVDGVSFQVGKGEIVGLLGPNGAGKTTSFRMACGLINTNGGVVYLGTQDVTNWPMYRRSREGGMGYLPQEKSVFQKLSVQNNLLGVMEMLGIKRSVRKRRCDELLEKLQLTHLRYNYAGGLSGGERRRLEIARSLVSEPKIILLDEPFAAVDPITVTGIQEIIRQLSNEGISILITDHSVQDTLQITQRSYVIQAGKVLCHGTPAEVLGNPEARKVYFGENVNVNNIHSVSLFPDAEKPVGKMSDLPVEDPTLKSPGHVGKHKRTKPHEDHGHSSVSEWDVSGPERDRSPEIPMPQPPKAALSQPRRIRQQRPPEAVPEESPQPVDEGALVQAEMINRRQHAVTSETKTRRIGRRLKPTGMEPMPERPIVRSDPEPASPPMPINAPPEEPAAGMSGIIQTLGSLIWKK